MKIAIYARVSTVDKGQDTENQLIQLREYCNRQGWTIYKEYVDHISGKNVNRDEFKAMFTDASRRLFDIVLVWALDRFTREGIFETFDHIKRLSGYGVRFESYTEQHFRTTGPAGELMIAIAAWIATQERGRLVERVKAGIERYKATPEHKRRSRTGKNLPLGRPKLIFNRETAVALRDSGFSLGEIAKDLGISKTSAARLFKPKT